MNLPPSAPPGADEPGRVAERYARRPTDDRYGALQPDVAAARQERQRVLIALLRRHLRQPLAETRALEVGCGHGDNLLELLWLGASPGLLQGNELLPERAAIARQRLPPATALHSGDALQLQLPPASLDMVLLSTVFSSILDDAFQQRLAQHIWAWLRPGGGVLWYDFTWDNPGNPDVRGMPLARVRQRFPAAHIDARRVTLAPPLARPLGRALPGLYLRLYPLFNALPLLRTHRLAWIEKPR